MVTQSLPIPAAPCALPEIPESAVFAASYVALPPDQLSAAELKAAALAIIADAGLHSLLVGVQQDVDMFDRTSFSFYAYEPVYQTLVFSVCVAPSAEEALAKFSFKLGEWGRKYGLLPALQTMEGVAQW